MQTAGNLRRLAGTVALMTATVGGALATSACTPTVPTATLDRGTVTVTGTAARDVLATTIGTNEVTVDFGADRTVDARFSRSQVRQVQVLAGDGDDRGSVSGPGVGDVPTTISGGIGNDRLSVVGNIGDTGEGDVAITINGDDGNDNLVASAPGPVTVQAGAGDDRVEGGDAGIGQETVSLGAGNDLFVGSLNAFVGRRSDIVDGGTGRDTMEVEGTSASEGLSLSASSGHLIIDHDLRDRIDSDNVEFVTWFGFGGLAEDGSGDAIAVNDLTATDLFQFRPDFSNGRGTGTPNNSSDTLTVRGTPGADEFQVSGTTAINISVAGLTIVTSPTLLQPEDFLRIETLEGDDLVDSGSLVPGLVQFLVL